MIGRRGRAWFAAGSHGQAAALAAAVADAGPPVPDLRVRQDGVLVTGATRAVADLARGSGLVAAPEGPAEVRVRVESLDPAAVEPFWRTALGDDPWRRLPAFRFDRSPEARPLRNRPHVDVGLPGPVRAAVAALRDTGGRVTRTSEWYSTVADADGNEVDVVPGAPLEGAEDWRAMFGAMVCYPGASAAFAAAAAKLADGAGIPLMIDVRPEGVVLDSGKDQWERVPGFTALAAAVQAEARAAGLSADPGGLRFVQVGIDAVDVPAVREFWRATLGYVPSSDPRLTDLHDPRELGPVVFIQPMDAADTDRRRQRNRLHLELLLPADQVAARVETALAAGGRLLGDGHLADPEGNELFLTG